MNPFDRNTNLEIIQQLRNSEKISLDDYIEKILIPLKDENPNFLKVLYKDFFYLLEGLDKESDNDLLIVGGDFLIEDGEIKLTGYQTRLHDIMIWLHTELISDFSQKTSFPNQLSKKLEDFEKNFLRKENFTPEYKVTLDEIKESLRKERKNNYKNMKGGLKKYLDPDILELKPNIFGLGINLNEIINKLRKK